MNHLLDIPEQYKQTIEKIKKLKPQLMLPIYKKLFPPSEFIFYKGLGHAYKSFISCTFNNELIMRNVFNSFENCRATYLVKDFKNDREGVEFVFDFYRIFYIEGADRFIKYKSWLFRENFKEEIFHEAMIDINKQIKDFFEKNEVDNFFKGIING